VTHRVDFVSDAGPGDEFKYRSRFRGSIFLRGLIGGVLLPFPTVRGRPLLAKHYPASNFLKIAFKT
jgi:hypothetical protein